jgi:hypothetical protein
MRRKLLRLGLLALVVVLVIPATSSFGQDQEVRIFIDDFEILTEWWSYEAGSNFFNCQITNTGYDSNNALEIAFDVGKTGSPGCGFDQFTADAFWTNTEGLAFMWRANLSYMAVQVIVRVLDPTQTNPDADGLTDFEAYVLTEGDEWSVGQVAWNDFEKSDWVGDSGVDVLDPSRIFVMIFSVAEYERGTVWIDNLYAVEHLPEAHTNANEMPPIEIPAP